MKCNQICCWNDSSDGCLKPKGRICPMSNMGMPKKQQTNADRIRARNDHELAETIADFVSEIYSGEVAYSDDPNDWLKWLQQPAEAPTENADRCVCCGAIIPEGQIACPNCLVVVKKDTND